MDKGHSLTLELTEWPITLRICLSARGYRSKVLCLTFYVGSGGPNLGPRACMTLYQGIFLASTSDHLFLIEASEEHLPLNTSCASIWPYRFYFRFICIPTFIWFKVAPKMYAVQRPIFVTGEKPSEPLLNSLPGKRMHMRTRTRTLCSGPSGPSLEEMEHIAHAPLKIGVCFVYRSSSKLEC